MKSLVIVESPHKAKTIGQFLGRNYLVKASMGHIRNLPSSQFGVDIEHGFTPKYVTIRGQGKIVSELKLAAKKVDRILLATDPDREGEAISWHLAQTLAVEDRAQRIEFHEITVRAVKGALSAPRQIDMNRVNAQQARRVLDRIIGYQLSPLLWKKIRPGLSAGRVQSVAVRLIVEREAEIRDFQKIEYWTIEVNLATPAGESFMARLISRAGQKLEIETQKEADEHARRLALASYRIEEVRRREKLRFPAAPFTTSTLQQEAWRKLGFSARRTMSVAQQLYEGLELGAEGSVGLITYMRTDSVNIAEEAQAEAAEFIAERYGEVFRPKETPKYKTKNAAAQEAHEAIRPTSVRYLPEAVKGFLGRDQARLYQLIWSRFVASQMKPAVMDTVSADVSAGDYLCRASGSVVKFSGFLEIYQEGQDEEAKEEEEGFLPPLREGDQVSPTGAGVQPRQHFTQPPPRYSEAMLVKALEEKGIGRPSTYAPTIETILKRNYVQSIEKRFHPTKLGEVVVTMLIEHFPDVVDIGFTAELENQLDRIEEGTVAWNTVVKEFYTPFTADLEQAKDELEKIKIEDEVSDVKCDQCGRMMVIKFGRFGRFLACPGYPECKNTKPLRKELGVACPVCGKPVVERRTKKGRRFYGCSAYPACSFVSWEPPARVPCPQCGSFAVAKGGKNQPGELVCTKEGCGYRGPLPDAEPQ